MSRKLWNAFGDLYKTEIHQHVLISYRQIMVEINHSVIHSVKWSLKPVYSMDTYICINKNIKKY